MRELSFFILVGAPRSGTTSIAYWLRQHPDIRLHPDKEPRFFTNFSQVPWAGPKLRNFLDSLVSDEDRYLSAFSGGSQAHWAMDASTDYLWCEDSPQLIKEWSRRFRVRVACILRNPVDRIVSEYQVTIRDGMQTESLQASLALENQRFTNHWHPLFYHVRRSSYTQQVQRYRETFGPDFLTLDFAELKQPDRLIGRLLEFLDLPSTPIDTSHASNASFVYRSPLASELISKRTLVGDVVRRVLPKQLRRQLRSRVLQRLIAKSYQPTDAELSLIKTRLADEIARCREMSIPGASSWA